MFGVNYFGAPYFAQGQTGQSSLLIRLLRASTRFIAGFKRTTRREF